MNLSVRQLIEDFETVASAAGFSAEHYGQIAEWPLLSLSRRSEQPGGQNIYLSAGIHGDEPAAPLALLELLRENRLPREHSYWICPLLNPTGLSLGTRENQLGVDLNRDYNDPQSEEIRKHTAWVQEHIDSLDLSIHLHEDWEAKGFYLYELNFCRRPSKAPKIIDAATQYLPLETAPEIDGSPAQNGLIRPEVIPEIEEGHPEAFYFIKRYGGLNYTIETPSGFDIAQRIAAHKAAILSIFD